VANFGLASSLLERQDMQIAMPAAEESEIGFENLQFLLGLQQNKLDLFSSAKTIVNRR
jgi:hypothetical protein